MNKNSKPYEDFLKEMNDLHVNYDYELLNEYNGIYHTRARCTCRECGYTWETDLKYMIKGKGCYRCADKRNKQIDLERRTKEFYEKLDSMSFDFSYEGEFKNKNSSFKCKCNKCGHEWSTSAGMLSKGQTSCIKCRTKANGIKKRKTHEQFIKDLRKLTDEIEIISEYKTSKDKVICKCKHCNHKWKAAPHMLLRGTGLNCPMCSTTDSIPNRFVGNCLKYSGIEFIKEFCPEWANKRRYDFYIPKENMIIEVHGGQHYKEGFSSLGGKTFQQEKENDDEKRRIAIENGIEKYIIVNASKSSKKWLTEHVMQSDMSYLISKEINFDEVFKNCYTSNTYAFAQLYNSGITDTKELQKELDVSRNSVYRLKTKAKESGLIVA